MTHKITRSEVWANSEDIYSGVLVKSDLNKIHIKLMSSWLFFFQQPG